MVFSWIICWGFQLNIELDASKDGLNNHPPNEVAVGQFSNSGISRVIFRNRVVFYAQMGRLRAL